MKKILSQFVSQFRLLVLLVFLGGGGLIAIVLVGVGIYWLFTSDAIEEWRYGKTWWDGVETLEVCGATPETEGQCYMLQVASEDGLPTTIYFPNGGYLTARDISCHKAADGLYSFDRFCRFWDQDGRKWDIQPHPLDQKHKQ